jgi:hypothetical protein
MVYVCPECGSSISEEEHRCPSCGTKVEEKDSGEETLVDVDEILEDISSKTMETEEENAAEEEDEDLDIEENEEVDEPLEAESEEPVSEEEEVDESHEAEPDESIEDEEEPSEPIGEVSEEPLAAAGEPEGWSKDDWEKEEDDSEDEADEGPDEEPVAVGALEPPLDSSRKVKGTTKALSPLGLLTTILTLIALIGTMLILRWDTWINGAEVESIGDNQMRFVYLGIIAVASFIVITIIDAIRQRRKVVS